MIDLPNPTETLAHRKHVLAQIDKAESEMLPGGLTADDMAFDADAHITHLKNSGALLQRQIDRAHLAEIQVGEHA